MEILASILSHVTAVQIALAWAVVVAAAVLRAFTGFGFGLAAVPIFALFMSPGEAVVLSTSLTLAISLTTLRTYWGGYPIGALAPLLLAALLGTALGVALLGTLDTRQFRLTIGPMVILSSLVLALYRGRQPRAHPALGGLTGFASGLLNGLFAIPGPPVIVYAMATETDPRRSRALLMTFFLFTAAMALPIYGTAGLVTRASPWLFLLAFPAMYGGDRLGHRLFRQYGTLFYRRVALLVLFAVGAGVTLKALQ